MDILTGVDQRLDNGMELLPSIKVNSFFSGLAGAINSHTSNNTQEDKFYGTLEDFPETIADISNRQYFNREWISKSYISFSDQRVTV